MSNTFDFLSTPLAGLFEIQRKQLTDDRGFLSRLFCSNEFNEVGLKKPFVQVNHTKTNKKGTIRLRVRLKKVISFRGLHHNKHIFSKHRKPEIPPKQYKFTCLT